jgi:hypothetical protein
LGRLKYTNCAPETRTPISVHPQSKEGIMPSATSTPEVGAVESAYQDQIKLLFSTLCTNLSQQPVTHQTDQQCVDRFTAGFQVAKRARVLALDVVGAASPATAAAQLRKRK